MIRLLYCSQAKPEISKEDIENILQTSRKNNSAAEITGALMYGGGRFMQVLEGPEQAVLRTYVNITDDTRHSNCRMIYVTPVKDRLFSTWTMAMVEGEPLTLEHVAKLRAHRLESVKADAFFEVMREFSSMLKPVDEVPNN